MFSTLLTILLGIASGFVLILLVHLTVWAAMGFGCLWMALVIYLLDIFKNGGHPVFRRKVAYEHF